MVAPWVLPSKTRWLLRSKSLIRKSLTVPLASQLEKMIQTPLTKSKSTRKKLRLSKT